MECGRLRTQAEAELTLAETARSPERLQAAIDAARSVGVHASRVRPARSLLGQLQRGVTPAATDETGFDCRQPCLGTLIGYGEHGSCPVQHGSGTHDSATNVFGASSLSNTDASNRTAPPWALAPHLPQWHAACTGLCATRLRRPPQRLGVWAVEDEDEDDGCESEHGSEGSDYVGSSTDESGDDDDDFGMGNERNRSAGGGRSRDDECFAGAWEKGGSRPIRDVGPCGPSATHAAANDEALKQAMDSGAFDAEQSGLTATGHIVLIGTLNRLDSAVARLLGPEGSCTSMGLTLGDIIRALLDVMELALNSSKHGLPPNMKRHHNVPMHFFGFYGKHCMQLGVSDVFAVEAAKRGERGLANVYTCEDELPAAGDEDALLRMSFVPVPQTFAHPQTPEEQQVILSRVSQARPLPTRPPTLSPALRLLSVGSLQPSAP